MTIKERLIELEKRVNEHGENDTPYETLELMIDIARINLEFIEIEGEFLDKLGRYVRK